MLMNDSINIAGTKIGYNCPPFIIAEVSGNHKQSLERALEIVTEAANAGVHAVKLQTYTPDTMTIDVNDREFRVADSSSLWFGESLFSLYQRAQTPWEWHKPIFEKARELGMIAFSTPFDSKAVDFLENLDVPCYKIASSENVDLALIRRVAETGKPLIISTGMATLAELDDAVSTARDAGCKDLILLKCSSTYPALAKDSNVLTIPHLKSLFKCEVGISDHTRGIGVAIASVALGATVIEKHLTLDHHDGAVDSEFSMTPSEMTQLVLEARQAHESLGQISYGPTTAELESLKYRRSLYIVEDMIAGDNLTHANLRAIRPGLGLPPKYISELIGKQVRADVKRGTPLTWNLI